MRARSSATRIAASSIAWWRSPSAASRSIWSRSRRSSNAPASSTRSADLPTSPRCVDGVPRATNVEYYARIVKEKSTLRSLIFSANKILSNAYEADQDADLILDEAESAIFSVADDRIKSGFIPMRDLVKDSFPKIEQLFEHKSFITGIATGFAEIDKMTRGFQRGDLIIVAARPSMGKTSLVLNIAQHVATNNRSPASSASKCRKSSCSCACSRPRRRSTTTG